VGAFATVDSKGPTGKHNSCSESALPRIKKAAIVAALGACLQNYLTQSYYFEISCQELEADEDGESV
jgi:hypothetical protein